MEEYNLWKLKTTLIKSSNPSVQIVTEQLPKTEHPKQEQKEPSCWRTIFSPPERGEDFTILQEVAGNEAVATAGAVEETEKTIIQRRS
uniref:Uncharacterized protein n=1 Tax=Cucumis sativus TaxID=3659 RepID=A0A0A0KTI6_CUCSA